MGKSTVIVRQASYDYRILKPVIFEILDSFCGDLIRPGSRVVLKPNLLAPAPPEKAMVTHPLVVKAVTEYAIEKAAASRYRTARPWAALRGCLMKAVSGLP